MIWRLIGRPRPVPCGLAVRVSPPWRNFSKIVACCAGLMPGPLSATSTRASRSSVRRRTVMRPAAGAQNLAAVGRGVRGTWTSRSRAAVAGGGPAAVGERGGGLVGEVDDEPRVALPEEATRRRARLLDPLAQVDRRDPPLRVAGLDLRQVEHLVDQARQALALLDDDA